MRTRMVGALSAMAAAATIAGSGCGSSGDGYENAARPPAPISVSVNLTQSRVAVSPARVGAGPVLLLIANESGRARDVTLTAAGGGRSCVESGAASGPINPQSSASLKLPLVQGVCEIGVADGELRPARLTVGAERPSAQQDLLQP